MDQCFAYIFIINHSYILSRNTDIFFYLFFFTFFFIYLFFFFFLLRIPSVDNDPKAPWPILYYVILL